MSTPHKVIRGGKVQVVDQLQNGDMQVSSAESEVEISSSRAIPPAGMKHATAIVCGPLTNHVCFERGAPVYIPKWVIMDDGRAYRFHRLPNKYGQVEVQKGDMIYPGGAIFTRTLKTNAMAVIERRARHDMALAKANVTTPPLVLNA